MTSPWNRRMVRELREPTPVVVLRRRPRCMYDTLRGDRCKRNGPIQRTNGGCYCWQHNARFDIRYGGEVTS